MDHTDGVGIEFVFKIDTDPSIKPHSHNRKAEVRHLLTTTGLLILDEGGHNKSVTDVRDTNHCHHNYILTFSLQHQSVALSEVRLEYPRWPIRVGG